MPTACRHYNARWVEGIPIGWLKCDKCGRIYNPQKPYDRTPEAVKQSHAEASDPLGYLSPTSKAAQSFLQSFPPFEMPPDEVLLALNDDDLLTWLETVPNDLSIKFTWEARRRIYRALHLEIVERLIGTKPAPISWWKRSPKAIQRARERMLQNVAKALKDDFL